MTEQQELISVESQWTKQMTLLNQISKRLLAQPYDADVYEWDVRRARECLEQMSKLAATFSNREPFGENYADACSGLRACVAHLEESLKLLAAAKKATFIEGANAAWERALKSSRR